MHELYGFRDAAVTLIPALTERGYQLTVSELARFRGGLSNKEFIIVFQSKIYKE